MATNLDCDVSFCDFPHVEANSRNHVFIELTGLQTQDECGKSRILRNIENADVKKSALLFVRSFVVRCELQPGCSENNPVIIHNSHSCEALR